MYRSDLGFTIVIGDKEHPYAEGMKIAKAQRILERNRSAPVKQNSKREQAQFVKMRERQARQGKTK